MKKLTLKDLQEYGDVYQGIKFAQSFYPEYPKKPTKPFLKNGHSSEDTVKYAESLKEYETLMEEYRSGMEEYRIAKNNVEKVIEEYIKDMAVITTVPPQYRDKVYQKAWADGHSSGFYEVYNCLNDLIEIFE